MNGIKLSGITYAHDSKPLFVNLSMPISNYSITCLAGPNGSGKSTLLQLMAGLLKPAQGAITLDKQLLHSFSRKALAKKLAYLPQVSRIPPSVTVREYVALARFCYQSWFSGLTDRDLTAIDNAISLTNLTSYADQHVTSLSAGQKQRARIALTLAQETDYILLDEPMTGLDVKQQRNILKLLVFLQSQQAKTIIVILHDLHQIMEIANEAIFLRDGRIVEQGHPRDIINADFIHKTFDYECDVTPIGDNKLLYITPKPLIFQTKNL